MSEPTPEAWTTLVARLHAGRTDALDVWYRREWPTVFRLCLGFLARHAAAEDAAQDSMLRLATKLEAGAAPRDYEAWRTAVVLNLCRDALRRSASRTRAEAAAETAHAGPAPLPDPADLAAQGEVRQTLEAALGHLTEREREALVLRDLEGLSTTETATAMGIAAGSVRSLLTLARRRLRACLGPRLGEAFTGEAFTGEAFAGEAVSGDSLLADGLRRPPEGGVA